MKACEGYFTFLYTIAIVCSIHTWGEVFWMHAATAAHRDFSARHLCYSRVFFCNSFSWLMPKSKYPALINNVKERDRHFC